MSAELPQPPNDADRRDGEYRVHLAEAALAFAGELTLAGLTAKLRIALAPLHRIRVGGLIIDDTEREILQWHMIGFRAETPDTNVIEVRRGEETGNTNAFSETDIAARKFVRDALPAELRDLFPPNVGTFRSVLLSLGDRFKGRLFAAFADPPPLADEDEDYFEQLAHLITPIAWNCFTRERFERGDRRREVLIQLSAALNASLELDAILASARKAVELLAGDAGCSIDLLEPDGDQYRVHPAGGRLHPACAKRPDDLLPVASSALRWVCEHARTYESDDLQHATRFAIDSQLRDAGILRYVIVPMIVRGRVIGALFMGSTEPHPALRVDVWLYENMALQVGLAIESARQLHQLRDLSERLTQHNIYLQEEIRSEHDYSDMIGRSPGIRQVRQAIDRVAGTDATVLITGQTGVGKELVARAIHAASTRAAAPMVKVNCAAIPESMVESELFGHERGAFTSAVEQHIGRFELANEGTLFLDEIGELSLAVQAKLLRVLQDGEFERVGGSKTIKTDARIIAATNRDIHKSVDSKSFRRDLYYRLNVFPIHVPSLEERREDIPLLVDAFVAQFGRRMGKFIERVEPHSLTCLVRRSWPGNIRELRHVIERAMILCDENVLRVDCAAPTTPAEPPPPQAEAAPPPALSLDEAQAEHIRRALAAANQVIEGPRGAAAALGIKPSTLRSRMKRLGIERG